MDIVDELFDSDAASALTNRAAREIARLRDENARLRAELIMCGDALLGPIYMDLPDGGSVTVAEQLARMAKDAARYRWLRNIEPEVPKAVLDVVEYGLDDLDDAIDAAMRKGGDDRP